MLQEIEQVNKKRRFNQMKEYDTFYRLHNQVHGLYSKNIDLEKECLKMEQEIGSYQKQISTINEESVNRQKLGEGENYVTAKVVL
jgi:peptidoglycan hydrolase CwlO-like protein